MPDQLTQTARQKRAQTHKLTAWLLMALAIAVLAVSTVNDLSSWVVAVLYAPPFYLALYVLKRSRQLSSKSAGEVRTDDKRPPVLYLRSFEADTAADHRVELNSSLTEEEQIARAMNEIGPFVAIGKPGEPLPQLGAHRTYVSHDEWQAHVRKLMQEARLIILRAGDTEGFWWEVEHASKNVAPEKLVVLLPFNKAQYDSFRAKAESLVACHLPDYPVRTRREAFNLVGRAQEIKSPSIGSLHCVLYFSRDWTPHIDRLTPPFYLGRQGLYRLFSPPPITMALKLSLSPVLKAIGAQWKRAPRLWPIRVASVAAIIAAAVLPIAAGIAWVEFTQNRANAHMMKGLQLVGAGSTDEAIEEFKTATKLSPTSGAQGFLCASLVKYKKEFAEGERECRKATDIFPMEASLHYNLAEALLQTHPNLDDALAEYQIAAYLNPKNATIHNDLCFVYAKKNFVQAAVGECRRATELAPNDPDIRDNARRVSRMLKQQNAGLLR